MCRRLRRMAAILFLSGVLCGCASMSLSDNATDAERRAAMCLDARSGLAMADAALAGAQVNTAECRYWMAFRAGAQIAISTYCEVQQ